MHGFAIHITPQSLPPFLFITPCGIQGVQMTCLEHEMPADADKTDLMTRFEREFAPIWQSRSSAPPPRLKQNTGKNLKSVFFTRHFLLNCQNRLIITLYKNHP